MIGYEYQLYHSQPPLYVIRKVQRTSQKEGFKKKINIFPIRNLKKNLLIIIFFNFESHSYFLLLYITWLLLSSS